MQEIDLEAFRLSPSTEGFLAPRNPRHDRPDTERGNGQPKKWAKQLEPFVRGPIPLAWLQLASKSCGGSAIKVGLVLFYLAGMKNSREDITITVKRCEPWGLQRKAVKHGLNELEKAGLVRIDRSNGRAARVDILKSQTAENQQVATRERM